MTFSIERIDAISRDVCRLFAEGERVGVVAELTKARNPTEAALIAAMASDKMTPFTRKAFIDFLTLQALSLST